MTAAFQIVAFALSAFVAIAGALGMTTTMSMFRSGIFLMASFFGVAGLFILLSADLIGILQIMMYIGGMLVMILFMVLFMPDPGGAMMAGMEDLAPLERWFSKGLAPRKAASVGLEHGEGSNEKQAGDGHSQHHKEDEHDGHEMKKMGEMDMSDMSMTTPVRSFAVWLASAAALFLVAMLLLRPSWPVVAARPDPESARRIGHLLMEKYMVGFEGAGVLILIGIFGAVLMARPSSYPDDPSRDAKTAVAEKPPSIADDRLPLPPANKEPAKGSDL